MTRLCSLAALVFVVTVGLTTALMTDRNTAFCNVAKTNVGVVLCRIEHASPLSALLAAGRSP